MLFGTLFDTLHPVGTLFGTIADDLLARLARGCTCSEDNERYTRICGSIDMLEILVEQGNITPEIARTSMRAIWMDRGLEEEEVAEL